VREEGGGRMEEGRGRMEEGGGGGKREDGWRREEGGRKDRKEEVEGSGVEEGKGHTTATSLYNKLSKIFSSCSFGVKALKNFLSR
jgi:hypothetical protein